jgi:hypothetical protein
MPEHCRTYQKPWSLEATETALCRLRNRLGERYGRLLPKHLRPYWSFINWPS